MPPLPNPRHEKFCQNIARGMNQTKAYEMAGYKPIRQDASRLMLTNADIPLRIEELFEESIPSIKYDREAINQIYTYLLKKAKDGGKIETAKSITDSLARVNGHMIQRTEHGKAGEFDSLSDHELLELIAAPLGDSRAASDETD